MVIDLGMEPLEWLKTKMPGYKNRETIKYNKMYLEHLEQKVSKQQALLNEIIDHVYGGKK